MKFKTLTFGCQSRKEFLTFKLDVGVSKSDGRFYAKHDQIPDDIWKTSKHELEKNSTEVTMNKIYSETLSDLKYSVENMIRHHEEVIKKEGSEKVIAYKFRMQADLTPDLDGRDKDSIRYNDFLGEGSALILGLEWHVLNKNTVGGETEYFMWTGSRFNMHSFKEIPWTEAREKWFEGLEESLLVMMRKAHDFMQIDAEHLTLAIDTGKLVPLITGGTDGKAKK